MLSITLSPITRSVEVTDGHHRRVIGPPAVGGLGRGRDRSAENESTGPFHPVTGRVSVTPGGGGWLPGGIATPDPTAMMSHRPWSSPMSSSPTAAEWDAIGGF